MFMKKEGSACIFILFLLCASGLIVSIGCSPVQQKENKIEKARKELSKISVALRSYAVDHDTLPDSLFRLTTPIDFLPEVYNDPFGTGGPYVYKKLEGRKDFLIYSYGPDGDDDKGRIQYPGTKVDPNTNGDIYILHRFKQK